MITLRQVEAFKSVMESGTMLRAARQMGLSQPAVSRLIGDLEHGIGYPLFNRRKGRIDPRREADALYDEVDRAFVGLSRIAEAAQRIGRSSNGQLRVAVSPILESCILATVVGDFLAENPDVEISLEARLRSQIIEGVADGRYDIGISTEAVERPDVGVEPIARTHSACLVPAGRHPLSGHDEITPADLSDVTLIAACNPGPAWQSLERTLLEAGVQCPRRMTTTSADIGYAMVAAGLGVTFGPTLVAAHARAPGIRSIPFRPKHTFHIRAMYSPGKPPEGAAARFIQAYARVFQD